MTRRLVALAIACRAAVAVAQPSAATPPASAQPSPTAPSPAAPSPTAPPPAAPSPTAPSPAAPSQPPSSQVAAADAGSGSATAASETATKTADNGWVAIQVVGGLVALLVLAYLGGHRRVVRFQERLGISSVIAAGFPFVALGVVARLPQVGILNAEVLDRLRPVLHFGLGWLGFIIGAQLDIRVLDRVPKGTAYLILVEALGPFGITAAACGVVMLSFGTEGMSIHDVATWRDMILLGTAAAMTAPRKFRGFANRTWHEGRGVDVLLGQLDELVGVIGLLFITAYFRSSTIGTWALPDTAWVFVSLGLGVAIGVLIFAMIRVPRSNAEFLAVVLGGIAFASGLAGYLELSPIAICFIAGVLVTNFPNEQRDGVFRILNHLERPVHLLFLIIAGALWDVFDWRGWALVPLFVAGRVVGKWTGVLASKTAVGAVLPAAFAAQRKVVTPMSGLAIALVISVESLYHDQGIPWIVTAVIGGSLVTELLVARTASPDVPLNRMERARTPPAGIPIAPILDDLDDTDATDDAAAAAAAAADTDGHEGPIYPDEPPPRTGPT